MRRTSVLLMLLLALALPARAAGPVEVRASLDRPETDLGRSVVLRLHLEAREGVELEPPPAESLAFPPFEVRDAVLTPEPPGDGVRRWLYTVRLAAYEPGRVEVPPVTIPYRFEGRAAKAQSEALAVEVAPAPPEPKGEIRGLKPPEPAPIPAWFWAALGGAVLLLAGLGWLLWGLFRTVRRRASTPHGIALADLDRLERDPDLEPEKVLARAADVLRLYLARRYGVPAAERTTFELTRELSGVDGFPADLRPSVEGVLEEADLAKFARFRPEAASARERVRAVRVLVEKTRPAEGRERR